MSILSGNRAVWSARSTLPYVLPLVLTIFSMGAEAQVRKCVNSDGRVVYSDTACASSHRESGVNVNANTLDGSSLREEARRVREEAQRDEQKRSTDDAVAQALQKSSSGCKFSSYVYGDTKGKILADAAKQECLLNIEAKARGQQVNLDAYNMWKDHSTQKQASRQAALARASNAANAQAVANSINQTQNRQFTCRPNTLGTALNCN